MLSHVSNVAKSNQFNVHVIHAKRHRLQRARSCVAEKVPTLDRGPSGCYLRTLLLRSTTHHRS